MKAIFANIQFTVYDFREFQHAQGNIIDIDTLAAFLANDQEHLEEFSDNFAQANESIMDLRPVKYAGFLLAMSQKADTSAYRLSTDEEQMLSDFVAPSPAWNATTTLAITAAMRFGSNELLNMVANRVIDYASQFNADNIQLSRLNSGDLAYLLIQATINRDLQLASVLQEALTKFHHLTIMHQKLDQTEISAINMAPVVNFAQFTLNWVKSPTNANLSKINRLITQTANLSLTGLVKYFKRIWPLIKLGKKAAHNYELLDHHEGKNEYWLTDEWQFSGPSIKRLRQFYNLNLQDVSVNWQTATQSRLENEKTQMGFRDSLQLLNVLLLTTDMFYRLVFPIPFSDYKTMIFNDTISDKAERIKHAYMTTKATFRLLPEYRYNLLLADLKQRAAESSNLFDCQPDEEYALAKIHDLTFRGVFAAKHFQSSDVIAFLDASGHIDTDDATKAKQLKALQHIISHASFDIKRNSALVELLSLIIGSLIMVGDGDAILKLRFIQNSIDYNRIFTTFAAAYSYSELYIKLYTPGADVPAIESVIRANRQTMREFVQPTTNPFMSNIYEDDLDEVFAIAEKWQKDHATT